MDRNTSTNRMDSALLDTRLGLPGYSVLNPFTAVTSHLPLAVPFAVTNSSACVLRARLRCTEEGALKVMKMHSTKQKSNARDAMTSAVTLVTNAKDKFEPHQNLTVEDA